MRSTPSHVPPSSPLVLTALPDAVVASGGDGLVVDYGLYASPFGPYGLAQVSQGVCYASFLDTADLAAVESDLRSQWPQARLHHNAGEMLPLGDQIFAPAATESQSPLRASVAGTPFQRQVWQALLTIPWGTVISYQDLAQRLGRPTAARAVGAAIGRNPVAYLIPCHRVVRGSGNLGGFRWGLDRKAALLAWESGQAQTTLPF